MLHRLSLRATCFTVPRFIGLAIGIAVGLSLVIGVSLVAAQRGAPGDTPTAQSYQGCVNSYTGVLRIIGAGEQCQDHEMPIQIGGSASDAALMERIEVLETENEALQETVANQQGYINDLVQQHGDQQTAIEELQANQVQIPACLTTEAVAGQERDDIVFEGCNVHVRSGAGATNATINGLGNLIVGYNEADANDTRTGSHNLVVGPNHSYSAYGGLVAGAGNTVSGEYSSVTGGVSNVASGATSSVSGGGSNTASAGRSSISGGTLNTASSGYSSISGGSQNVTNGEISTISGGIGNETNGGYSTVSGGFDNSADGVYSTVSGGAERSVTGLGDWRGGEFFSED